MLPSAHSSSFFTSIISHLFVYVYKDSGPLVLFPHASCFSSLLHSITHSVTLYLPNTPFFSAPPTTTDLLHYYSLVSHNRMHTVRWSRIYILFFILFETFSCYTSIKTPWCLYPAYTIVNKSLFVQEPNVYILILFYGNNSLYRQHCRAHVFMYFLYKHFFNTHVYYKIFISFI